MDLNGHFSFLFSADSDGLLNFRDEYLTITNFSGFGGLDDNGHRALRLSVGQNEFNFNFGKEIDRVLAAAVDFRMAFLAAKAFYFTYRHTGNAHFSKSVFDLFEFKGLNYR